MEGQEVLQWSKTTTTTTVRKGNLHKRMPMTTSPSRNIIWATKERGKEQPQLLMLPRMRASKVNAITVRSLGIR